jgi:adenosylcobinamide-phosphate synthase
LSFLSIVLALAFEQWRAFGWRVSVERAFARYARRIEHRFNGGTAQHGLLGTVVAIAPPVVFAAVAYWVADALHPLLALAVNSVVLYFLMGFRRFSHAVSAITKALQAGDLAAARRALGSWRGGDAHELSSRDVAKLAIECGIVDAYRQVFAVLFWFVVLPGPAGAVLYRAAVLLEDEWRNRAGMDPTPHDEARRHFGRPARHLLWMLDWVPVRLTALSFAIVGDFEDAVACWRAQTQSWAQMDGGVTTGALLASGGGALGVVLGGALPVLAGEPDLRPEVGMGDTVEPEMLPSAIGLIWRALILWLMLILLATLANLAP